MSIINPWFLNIWSRFQLIFDLVTSPRLDHNYANTILYMYNKSAGQLITVLSYRDV